MDHCLPWEESTLEEMKSLGLSLDEGGAAEKTCDELTEIPVPCPSALLVGRR